MKNFTFNRNVFVILFCIFTIVVICVLCLHLSPHLYPNELVVIDSLSSSNPSKAHCLLKRIDIKSYKKDADKMYYGLIREKIANNLHQPIKDSTIFAVASYYEKNGENEKKSETNYYLGKRYIAYKDMPQALKCFQRALTFTDDKTPLSFLSKIYNQTGRILFYHDMYSEALDLYKKSYYCDLMQKDTINIINSLRDLAQVYKFLGRADSCELSLKKAYALSKKIDNKTLIKSVALVLGSLYVENCNVQKAHELFSANLRGNLDARLLSPSYSLAVHIYSQQGNVDSMLYYCKKLLKIGTINAKETALRKIVSYNVSMGNNDSIKKYLGRYYNVLDTVRLQNSVETVARMNSIYNYSLREKENAELKLKNAEKEKWIMFIVIFFVFSVLIFVTLSERRKKKIYEFKCLYEHLSNLYDEACSQSKHFIELKEEEIIKMQDMINALNEESSNEIKKYKEEIVRLKISLDKSLENNEKKKKSLESERLHIYDILRTNIQKNKRMSMGDWNSIYQVIESAYPDFKRKLCANASIDAREYRICILIKIGLHNADIAALMYRRESTISMARAKMYEKIFSKKGSPKDFDKYIMSL